MANILKERGIGKGDRACLYMSMIPEAVFAILPCACIARHPFSGVRRVLLRSLQHRVQDSDCRLVITADGYRRGGKTIGYKKKADQALEEFPGVKTVLVANQYFYAASTAIRVVRRGFEQVHPCQPPHL